MEKRTKESRKRINSLILLIAFTAIMLIVSTYAWFTSQKDITLSNLTGTVEVAENMEISLDAKTWKQEFDLTEAAVVLGDAQSSRLEALKAAPTDDDDTDIVSAAPILPTELLPVSGTGETGASIKKLPLYAGDASSTKLEDIAKCNEVTSDGYFAFDIYIKNTKKDGTPDTLQLNLNSAVQVLPEAVEKTVTDAFGNSVTRTYIGDAASGLQNTVRVGLALYDGEVDSTSTQKQILEATKTQGIVDVAIWEPNSTDHAEYIVENNNKLVNGTQTHTTFANGAAVDTYALNSTAPLTTKIIENVYNVGDPKLSLQQTFKTENQKDNQGVITDYRIKPAKDAEDNDIPRNITNITGNEFKIESNKVSRLRVYVWLEGQDVDCINLASEGGGIEVDLGLTKDNFIGDVLTTD